MLDLMRSEASWARLGSFQGLINQIRRSRGHADKETQPKLSENVKGSAALCPDKVTKQNPSFNNVWVARQTTHPTASA